MGIQGWAFRSEKSLLERIAIQFERDALRLVAFFSRPKLAWQGCD